MAGTYPSATDIVDLLQRHEYDMIMDTCLFTSEVPYAFAEQPADYDVLLRHISEGLGVAESDLGLVGSGRTGFSMSPQKFGRPFGEQSDLDMIVVSHELFDQAWLNMLRRRSRLYRLQPQIRAAYEAHQQYVYFGRMLPHLLPGILDLAARWSGVFRSVARYPELSLHTVHGMLFHSWEHARVYHRYGLSQLSKGI